MSMGILYIATKKAKSREDLIMIYMPYRTVLALPKCWLSKIEITRGDGYFTEISRLYYWNRFREKLKRKK